LPSSGPDTSSRWFVTADLLGSGDPLSSDDLLSCNDPIAFNDPPEPD